MPTLRTPARDAAHEHLRDARRADQAGLPAAGPLRTVLRLRRIVSNGRVTRGRRPVVASRPSNERSNAHTMGTHESRSTARAVQAGLLSWLLPGAGHFFLRHRGLGAVCFVAITFPYFAGLAFGGIKDSVNPRTNRWLFLAELPAGGYTLPSMFVSRAVERHIAQQAAQGRPVKETDYTAFYPESDVAQIYLAAAGLLNLMVILDAVARAQTGGLPTFHRESPPVAEPGSAP